MELKESLKELVFDKSDLKQSIYMATREVFDMFRNTSREIIQLLQQEPRCQKYKAPAASATRNASPSPTAATSSSR